MFVLVTALVVSSLLLTSESRGQTTAPSAGGNGERCDADRATTSGRYLVPGETPEIAPQVASEQELSPKNDRFTKKADALGTTAVIPLPLLVAVGPQGIVTLNQNTGVVNFCVGYSYLGSGVPFGKCKKMGSISPTGLAGNARLDATGNYHAFVTNTATGAVLECYLGFYSGNGMPFGSCILQTVEP